MREILLLGTGVGVGFAGTLLGLGGGFILVPILLYFYRLDAGVAVGTSHAVIVLNAMSGAIAYDRQRKIDYDLALWLGAAAVPASALAAWKLVPRSANPWFLLGFAAMLAFGAAYITQRARLAEHEPSAAPTRGRLGAAVAVALSCGLVASTLGIGGGVFYVPVLAVLLGRPFHRATATSQFILLQSSLVAAAVLVWHGQCDLRFALWLGIGVIGGAQAGAFVAPKLKAPVLTRAFAAAVLLVAAKLAWDGIRGLR